jgi:hypothetical protein
MKSNAKSAPSFEPISERMKLIMKKHYPGKCLNMPICEPL